MAEEIPNLCLPEAISSFSHEELLAITSSVLNEVLSKDVYMKDLPSNATLDEINNHLAVLHGKSITLYVMRATEKMPVIVINLNPYFTHNKLCFCFVNLGAAERQPRFRFKAGH